jgi:hypothetical protein
LKKQKLLDDTAGCGLFSRLDVFNAGRFGSGYGSRDLVKIAHLLKTVRFEIVFVRVVSA